MEDVTGGLRLRLLQLREAETALNSVEIQPWEVLESSTVFSCPWLKVRKDICRSNRGNVVDYYVIDRFSYVLIVAVTPHSEVLVVRQYKHGAKQVVRELPAGYIEPGEDPVDCARRELREETGYEAERIEPLAVLFASPTAASNKAHIFLATGLVKAGDQQPDPNEKIVVEKMDLAAAVAAQPFQGLSSVAALLLAWQRWASEETTRCPSNPDSCSPSRQEKRRRAPMGPCSGTTHL
jgi:ADP-ribose pyrophosphatase